MIAQAPVSFRWIWTTNGHLVIRTEASGYELVWEIVSSARKAKARCLFWRDLEAERARP